MDNYNNYVIKEHYSLQNMLENNGTIEIPIIQRDYAQGRDSAKAVLEGFIKDIFDHLMREEPLKLSFVYGVERETDSGIVYIPYDGQQRLTLLYLFTLYFSAYNIESEFDSIKILSRFKYYTRDYATEFCEYLTVEENNVFQRIDIKDCKDIKQLIKDDISFMDSWTFDPTVKSMLNVFEEIHKEFLNRSKESDNNKSSIAGELLQKLKDGLVFFDWCKIEAEDDVYIKMNGRGKPLSAFDNFKNTLYIQLNKLKNIDHDDYREDQDFVLNQFESYMEDDWTTLFWENREEITKVQKDNHNIAPSLMNFLFFIFELRSRINNQNYYFGQRESFCWIDEKNVNKFIYRFQERCNGKDKNGAIVSLDDYLWMLDLMNLLIERISEDRKVGVDKYASEKELFYEVANSRDEDKALLSSKLALIAGLYYQYLVTESHCKNDNIEQYREIWIQLISRIIQTVSVFEARYDALHRGKNIFYGFQTYLLDVVFNKYNGNLIDASVDFGGEMLNQIKEYFDESHAFNQLYEELYKYRLIKENSAEWESRINKAESIEYLGNQILFLFQLSSGQNERPDPEEFDKYLNAISQLLNRKGIKNENKFIAILLAYGDYRIASEENNVNAMSLCSNKATKYYKWRHFFDIFETVNSKERLRILKNALDCIIENNCDVKKAYNTIKKTEIDEGWRKIIIKYPEVLNRANNSNIVYERKSKYYLICSYATTKVMTKSLEKSLNLDVYDICRRAGFKDDEIELGNESVSLPDGISLENGILDEYFVLKKGDKRIKKTKKKEEMINFLKQKIR